MDEKRQEVVGIAANWTTHAPAKGGTAVTLLLPDVPVLHKLETFFVVLGFLILVILCCEKRKTKRNPVGIPTGEIKRTKRWWRRSKRRQWVIIEA